MQHTSNERNNYKIFVSKRQGKNNRTCGVSNLNGWIILQRMLQRCVFVWTELFLIKVARNNVDFCRFTIYYF